MSALPLTSDELVDALDAFDVPFLAGGQGSRLIQPVSAAMLFAGLATQDDARLRLAIIVTLLRYPDLASAVPNAAMRLSDQAQLTLKLFYTAAMLLQQKYSARFAELLGPQPLLPDLYVLELAIPAVGDVQQRLPLLGEQHSAFTGLAINWVGTYEHAAQRLIKRMEIEAQWENLSAA